MWDLQTGEKLPSQEHSLELIQVVQEPKCRELLPQKQRADWLLRGAVAWRPDEALAGQP